VGELTVVGPRTCLRPTIRGTHGEIRCWVKARDEAVSGLKSQFVLTNTGGCEFLHPHLFDMADPLQPLTMTLPSFIPLYDAEAPGDSQLSLSYEWPALKEGAYTTTLALGVQNVKGAPGRLTLLGTKPFSLTLEVIPLVDDDGDDFFGSADCCVGAYGTVHGCPDEDGDGFAEFAETETSCADLLSDCCAGNEGEEQGCPDRDEDGFVDLQNTCGLQVDECPDEWALLPGGCCEMICREDCHEECREGPRGGEVCEWVCEETCTTVCE
jgi:hypothetical protein